MYGLVVLRRTTDTAAERSTPRWFAATRSFSVLSDRSRSTEEQSPCVCTYISVRAWQNTAVLLSPHRQAVKY